MKLFLDTSLGTQINGSMFGHATIIPREDDFIHNGVCHLVFDPRTHNIVSDPGWMIAQTDRAIEFYYAQYVKKRFGIELERSAWGSHISIIKGVLPKKNKHLWNHKAVTSLKIPFKYTHTIHTNGKHWWLNVQCEDFSNIREEFGLPRKDGNFHLTIGRTPQKLLGAE